MKSILGSKYIIFSMVFYDFYDEFILHEVYQSQTTKKLSVTR